MKPNLRVMLVLAAALIVAGAVFRQEKEMYRLRAAIAALTSPPRETISTVTDPLPADIEELSRVAAEVHRLRAELTQLRQEKVETSALQARIDKLASDVSAILENLNQRSDFLAAIGDFNHPAPSTSPLALQASALVQSSPQEAARWAASLPPGKDQDRAVLAVTDRWTDIDPAGAAAWTMQFAEGSLREEAMSSVARQWGLRDWNATAGWLEKLPNGSAKDAAIGAFVTSADGYDIRLALEWANQIEAPENRARRVEETARRWLREDNAAARAWLAKAQLPSGLAERLLSAK